MYDYSMEINCIRSSLEQGDGEVRRIRNKLGDLESDIIGAVKSDNMRFHSGDLDKMEIKSPYNDYELSAADDDLYRELDRLVAAIIEEQMKEMEDLV